MTSLSQLGSVESIIRGLFCEKHPIFHKPYQQISLVEMAAFAKECDLTIGMRKGRVLVKDLIAELHKLRMLGEADPCPATLFNLPTPKLTLGEFRRILLKFSPMERRLIVFALATGRSLVNASLFQHYQIKKDVNDNNWSNELRRFISATPRHITCPYLFWEFDENNQAKPLLDFDLRFKVITKASWQVFSGLCSNLIPLDTEQDGREFATMFVIESINDQGT